MCSECLHRLGVSAGAIRDAAVAAALERFYAPELQLRQMFPGALDMLQQLTKQGLRLSLVTNSADTTKQKRTISLFELDRWFGASLACFSFLLFCVFVFLFFLFFFSFFLSFCSLASEPETKLMCCVCRGVCGFGCLWWPVGTGAARPGPTRQTEW
jgi:hypothetical protein